MQVWRLAGLNPAELDPQTREAPSHSFGGIKAAVHFGGAPVHVALFYMRSVLQNLYTFVCWGAHIKLCEP